MMQSKDDRRVTQDKREKSCSLGEARYQAITETSVDAIVTTNEDGQIMTWNPGAEAMFGHGQEMVGQNVLEIIPQHYRKQHKEGLERYKRTGEKHHIGSHVEVEGLRANGEVFPLELSLSTWETDGGQYFGAIIRDLTERKRTESLREEVHRLMRHDLRSPLVGMAGMARSLLKKGGLTQEQEEKLELIEHLGKRSLKLIDRSRRLLLIEKDEFELEAEPVNLVDLLSSIAKSCSPQGGSTLNMRLSIEGREVSEEEPRDVFEVEGDPVLLENMLENLLRNAAEASPEEGVVNVDISSKDGIAVIDVHNMGVVPESIRQRFFEPYATAGKRGGTGLGTYSALLVANGHGGEIEFTSSKTEGTHVIVKLPKSRA